MTKENILDGFVQIGVHPDGEPVLYRFPQWHELRGTPRDWPGDIVHDYITEQQLTSRGAPEQYEGRLHEGTYFFFHLRHGLVSLGTGRYPDEAIDRSWSTDGGAQLVIGGDLGEFPDDKVRDQVFATLLRQAVPQLF